MMADGVFSAAQNLFSWIVSQWSNGWLLAFLSVLKRSWPYCYSNKRLLLGIHIVPAFLFPRKSVPRKSLAHNPRTEDLFETAELQVKIPLRRGSTPSRYAHSFARRRAVLSLELFDPFSKTEARLKTLSYDIGIISVLGSRDDSSKTTDFLTSASFLEAHMGIVDMDRVILGLKDEVGLNQEVFKNL